MNPKILKIIKPESAFWPVTFAAREGIPVKGAILEAAKVCRENDLEECDLNYSGFLFNITPGITENEIYDKMKQLKYSQQLKLN